MDKLLFNSLLILKSNCALSKSNRRLSADKTFLRNSYQTLASMLKIHKLPLLL